MGAGKTEVGQPAPNPSQAQLRGAVLPPLIDRLLAAGDANQMGRRYEVAETLRFDDIQTIATHARDHRIITSLDSRKVTMAMLRVELRGWDGVVLLIDRESKNQPDRAERMKAGRRAYRESDRGSRVACAAGASCRCAETWLLADAQARLAVFGEKTGPFHTKDCEARPNPKALKAFIDDRARKLRTPSQDVRVKLAREARPAELAERCPTSYEPFAKDVIAEIHPLLG